MNKYTEGTYVQHEMWGYRVKITKFLGNRDATGKPLYEAVDDKGEKHIVSEIWLKPYLDNEHKEEFDNKKNENEEKKAEIEEKTKKILEFLNINTHSDNQIIQLENAMKIHKYIAQNSSYTIGIMKEKENYNTEDAYLNELYDGIINKKGVCTTDSIIFKHLLSKIGMHGDVVISKSNEGGIHASTLVEIANESYYFDTTLERTIFEHMSNNPENFKFCCAALGKQEYGQYYSPIGVLPEDLNGNMLSMPKNISDDSVPKIIIQSIGNEMKNLTFNEETLESDLKSIEVSISKKDEAIMTISKDVRASRDVVNKDIRGES